MALLGLLAAMAVLAAVCPPGSFEVNASISMPGLNATGLKACIQVLGNNTVLITVPELNATVALTAAAHEIREGEDVAVVRVATPVAMVRGVERQAKVLPACPAEEAEATPTLSPVGVTAETPSEGRASVQADPLLRLAVSLAAGAAAAVAAVWLARR